MKARDMKNRAERTRYALFTGAAGGLASACIGFLLEKYPEWRVFAADKDGEKLRELAGRCGERVIDFSSECGFEKAQPFNTPYAVTKYGVEAYTDGLRRELNFLGIKVIKIQPGSFGTGLLDQAQRGFDDLRAGTGYYGEILDALDPLMRGAMSHRTTRKCSRRPSPAR